MIERSRKRLRIRCDVDGCERFYSPRPPVLDPFERFDGAADPFDVIALELRERARAYGWTSVHPDQLEFSELVIVQRHTSDACPEHSRPAGEGTA